MAGDTGTAPDPSRLAEEAEARTATATEQLVAGEAFGELLARATANALGLWRIASDTADLVVRNLRLAGRADIARLGRALARNEDKLERVLQEVELLRDELERARSIGPPTANGEPAATRRRTETAARGDPR
jgi:hypothetical protein